MVSSSGTRSLTPGPGHEFRQLDADACAGSCWAAQHGGQLRVGVPARGGDVEVGPGLAGDELAYEHATQDGPGLAVLRVPQVGDLASQQDAVVGVDRKPPDSVSGLP